MRGKLVSRPIGEVLQEAENLVHAGVKELLVVSQDTSAYGLDTKYQMGFHNGKPVKTRFKEFASALGDLDAWVRMHYVYPYPHVDDVIPLMAEGKILPYLDIPLQHSSQNILTAMKRPANSENMLKRIAGWREVCPDITLRSTFIVGFPGETEADFQNLLEFTKTIQFDRVGAFKYSAVEGASANELANAVPETLKEERLERLMEVQSEISFAKLDIRLAKYLLTNGSVNTPIRTTHQALATELGSAREVISRQLKEFENRGWVQLNRGKIEIINHDALASLLPSL